MNAISPDTSIPDTSIPDTSIPDTSIPDTSTPDTPPSDAPPPDEPATESETANDLLLQLAETSRLFNDEYSMSGTVGITVDTIWQLDCVDYVSVLLGESDLGPFRYVGLRGVTDPLRFLQQTCPMPLWGCLAQALVRRPAESEADYLLIHDIQEEGVAIQNEFPWIPPNGTVMIVPLRNNGRTIGAIVLGSTVSGGFAEETLRRYLYTIAGRAARALEDARQREEARQWLQQVVSLQLLTARLATSATDLDLIAATVRAEIADMMDGAQALLFLYPSGGPHSSQNFCHYPSAVPREAAAQMLDECGSELIEWVLQAEQPIFFEGAECDADIADLYYRDSGRSLIIPIPAVAGGQAGILHVSAQYCGRLFDENDLLVLRSMANCVATAVQALRLSASAAAQTIPASHRQP